MRLRNKKTGEIKDVESIGHVESLRRDFGYQVTLSWNVMDHLDTCKTYKTLAELNEEWEDVEGTNVPNMPLIEDEAKRNVFKAWAETLGRNLEKADFKYDAERNSFNCYIADSTIEFANGEGINCVDREIYTFRALCGEEEE